MFCKKKRLNKHDIWTSETDLMQNVLSVSQAWSFGNANGASVNKAHVVFSCCFANLLSTLELLTILFCKSIIKKSHVVWQTTLTRNNAAQWILLISCIWEPSRYLAVGTQSASEKVSDPNPMLLTQWESTH